MISSAKPYKNLKRIFLQVFEIYFSGEVFNLIITLALITFERTIEKKFDCNEKTKAFFF